MATVARTVGPLLLAAAGFGLGWWLRPVGGEIARDPLPSASPSPDAPAPSTPPAEACVPPTKAMLPAAPRHGAETLPAFAPGFALLRIGDGYVFGDDHATPGAEPEEVDVACEDVHGGVTLACAHGAIGANLPLAAVGLPDTATGAAGLLVDAPAELPERHATLFLRPTAQRTGVALVKARTGKTYKAWLVEERGDPNALKRLARIGYAEVPTADGGGLLRVASTGPVGKDATPTLSDLTRMAKAGNSVPGSSMSEYLGGKWQRLAPIEAETTVTNGAHVLLEAPLRSKVVIDGSYGAAFAAGGIDPDGVLENRTYAAFAVRGDMRGKVNVRSYAYVHVTGDLVGGVDAGSYATIVVDGDLVGTLKVRSYVTLLLRGRLRGKIDPSGSCWSTFYFQGFRTRADVEAMEGDFHQVTLHLESSDMPEGKVTPVPGTWQEVVVGDPAWKKIER